MAIYSRKWCDFVVYTEKGISVQRIEFDEIFWKDMLFKLQLFYTTAVLPKLVEQFK